MSSERRNREQLAMIKLRNDSNLLFLARFGVPPLIMGCVVTPFTVVAVRRFPQEGDAWLALTLSFAIMGCGLGAILYGWWLDWRSGQRRGQGELDDRQTP